MLYLGIDVGSTYTKYAIVDRQGGIIKFFSEKTPILQKEYFENKLKELKEMYDEELVITSCGYGKKNVVGIKAINELTALAYGINFLFPKETVALDIGGQDTKIIRQNSGKLKDFFINDKCAAGSGMFLANTCNFLGKNFTQISLVPYEELEIKLASTCAIFAQSEIVELLAKNVDSDIIISTVLHQIITQAKKLLMKIACERVVLTGGLSQISNIVEYAENILGVKCLIGEYNNYLSAIGCAYGELNT